MFIKRDIKNLVRQLDEISAADTNMRLTTETFDKDIVELCNAINAVLDERRSVALEAQRAGAELKRAITNISHDLRTPLTSALGYAQMLIADERGAAAETGGAPVEGAAASETPANEKRAEYLNIVMQRLKSLTMLMDSLFEYTRIIEGHFDLNPEKTNICNILREVISQFYDDFTSRGFDVVANIPETPIYVQCDGAAFTRIAQNLTRNAIEHGCGHFELTAQDDGEIVFCNRVKNAESLDTGRLFERFYTADLSRSSGNAGLGMAIAKELTEKMGGKIAAGLNGEVLSVSVKL